MALYSKPVRVLMKEMAADLAKSPDATFTRQDAINWFAQKYPKIKVGTVTAHMTRLSTNARSRTHYSAKPGEDDVLYQIDGSHYRHYRPGQDPAPIYAGQTTGETPKVPEGEDEEMMVEPSSAGGEFAYEADLRNYLSKNLSKLEPGLRVYEEEGITGIEFSVGGRFIDILAPDANGGLVVIELKVSRGYDRVVGQLMPYVAWIKKNLAESSQNVRGVIVAREISEDLLLACSMVPGVELFEYELSLSLRRVNALGMTIDQRGLRVGAAPRTSLADIERFLRHNATWVLKKLDEWHGHGQARHLAVCDGALIPVLGEECVVRIQAGANRVRWAGHTLILLARPDADLRQLARRALRNRALEIFEERAAHYAAHLHRPLPRVALSNAQTRWGSCSEKSGIRLSWRLIHAPPRLLDYVVAHEMAHLVEMNHSPRFWKVVERLCPDYRAARDELRRLAATCPQL